MRPTHVVPSFSGRPCAAPAFNQPAPAGLVPGPFSVSSLAMRWRHDISLGSDELSCPRPVGRNRADNRLRHAA